MDAALEAMITDSQTAHLHAGKRYGEELRSRADREAQTLAALTSWPIDEIRTKMRAD